MAYIERRINKYVAIKTEYGGSKYDSKFEASVAHDLDLRLKAGEIKDWDRQFKVEMWAYNCHGDRVLKVSHKVDFRVHEHDGSYTLLEAKGIETADYKMRREWLELFWLPENLDHAYQVVKEKNNYRHTTKKTKIRS